MLDLSTENKALCFEDSTRKPLYIFLYYWQEDSNYLDGGYWQYYTTIDDAIVLESMELDEGILDSKNFELGSFVVSSMKVQWQNNGIRYKDMIAVPVQQIGDEYIAYFDGTIIKEEISADGQIITAELTTLLSQKLDIDVLEYIKEYSGYDFYIMLRKALSKVGIEFDGTQAYYRFANIDTIISLNKNTLPNKITVSELLKQAGEFLGAHIVFNKEKRIVNIDEMKTYRPSARPTIDFIRFANVDTVAQSNIKALPSEYKRVEYIQTNGTQYINTGYLPNDKTKVEIDFYNFADYLSVSDVNNQTLYTTVLFGSRDDLKTNAFVVWTSVNELNEIKFDFGNQVLERLSAKVVGRLKISASANEITINGKTTTVVPQEFNGNYPLYLFANNTGGTIDERRALGKLYSFKIYEDDVLQRDMIPCVRVSDSYVGLYDLVNGGFYTNEGMGEFISPNPVETYILPYYINLYADKTNRVKFDEIRVLTETGDSQSGQRNYTFGWNNDIKTTYEIKNNIFFEALSTQYWWYCERAVREVGSYLEEQNLYYADLQTVYPPFIEGGDYLIVKSKNQNLLPSEYLILDNITLSNKNINSGMFINIGITPNSDDIEIEIDFSLLGGLSYIFIADGKDYGYDTLSMYADANSLISDIGYYGGSAQQTAFNIPYVPINQKINLNIKCGNEKYEYKGTFNGNGSYFGGNIIYTKPKPLMLGSAIAKNVNYKLYHFAYSQGGNKMCDMYPCMRKSDGVIGVYDIVRNTFKSVRGIAHPEYETADTVIPILSTTTSGIHSMRADILCKATNTNKN